MVADSARHFQQIGHQPGVVANPARGQLNMENGITRVCGVPSPASRTVVTSRLLSVLILETISTKNIKALIPVRYFVYTSE